MIEDWAVSHGVFQLIYTATQNRAEQADSAILMRGVAADLRERGRSVKPIRTNGQYLLIEGAVLLSIVTADCPLDRAAVELRAAMLDLEHVRVGYVLWLGDPPRWKKVHLATSTKGALG